MSEEIEIWKPLIYKGVDYTGHYEVSNLARVKSLERIVKHGDISRHVPEKILKNILMLNGYHMIGVSLRGVGVKLGVARAVATAFIPNPDNKPQVNHIDANKLNNLPSNLEWCTAKENAKHAIDMGLRPPPRKLKEYQVIEIIKRSLNNENRVSIARDYGVCPQNIISIMTNKTWKHLEK